MQPLIPFLIMALSFAAVAAVVFVLGHYLAAQSQMQRRLPAPAQSVGLPGEEEERVTALRAFITKHFSDQQFGIDSTVRGRLRHELVRAGYFRSDALNYYLFFRMALPVVFPAVAYVVMVSVWGGASWYIKLLVACIALAFAIIGPDIYLDRRQKRLAQRYKELFPDLLDLLVVCIDAGLSLEAAFARVTTHIVKQSRELGLNLMMMGSEMRAGRRTIDALTALADRLMIDEAQSLTIVLRQSLELGSDVGNTLRVFAEEMRDRRVLRAEEKANKLPVKMSIPLALLIFPTVLIVIMFPVVLRVLKTLTLH
jgi:tight adherence protein C